MLILQRTLEEFRHKQELQRKADAIQRKAEELQRKTEEEAEWEVLKAKMLALTSRTSELHNKKKEKAIKEATLLHKLMEANLQKGKSIPIAIPSTTSTPSLAVINLVDNNEWGKTSVEALSPKPIRNKKSVHDLEKEIRDEVQFVFKEPANKRRKPTTTKPESNDDTSQQQEEKKEAEKRGLQAARPLEVIIKEKAVTNKLEGNQLRRKNTQERGEKRGGVRRGSGRKTDNKKIITLHKKSSSNTESESLNSITSSQANEGHDAQVHREAMIEEFMRDSLII